MKISDAFRSTQISTTTSKNDFEDNWKFFGTLGAKGFYPFNKAFGIGAFVQGSYYFRDFTDNVSGMPNPWKRPLHPVEIIFLPRLCRQN